MKSKDDYSLADNKRKWHTKAASQYRAAMKSASAVPVCLCLHIGSSELLTLPMTVSGYRVRRVNNSPMPCQLSRFHQCNTNLLSDECHRTASLGELDLLQINNLMIIIIINEKFNSNSPLVKLLLCNDHRIFFKHRRQWLWGQHYDDKDAMFCCHNTSSFKPKTEELKVLH